MKLQSFIKIYYSPRKRTRNHRTKSNSLSRACTRLFQLIERHAQPRSNRMAKRSRSMITTHSSYNVHRLRKINISRSPTNQTPTIHIFISLPHIKNNPTPLWPNINPTPLTNLPFTNRHSRMDGSRFFLEAKTKPADLSNARGKEISSNCGVLDQHNIA